MKTSHYVQSAPFQQLPAAIPETMPRWSTWPSESCEGQTIVATLSALQQDESLKRWASESANIPRKWKTAYGLANGARIFLRVLVQLMSRTIRSATDAWSSRGHARTGLLSRTCGLDAHGKQAGSGIALDSLDSLD